MFEIDKIPQPVMEAAKMQGITEDRVEFACFSDRTLEHFPGEVFLFASKETLSVICGVTAVSQQEGKKLLPHGQLVTHFKVYSVSTYQVASLKKVRVEEQLSGGNLIAEKNGETVLLAEFTNSCKASVFLFAKYLNCLCQGGEPVFDDKDRPESNCCPKCGMRYPDKNRKVCPHCMAKDQLFRRIWVFLVRYKVSLIFTLISLIVLTGMSILSPYLSKGFFFDEVISSTGKFYGQILFVLGLIIATKTLSVLATIVNNWITSLVAAKMVFDLKKTIFSSIERLSLGFFTGRQTGGLMTQVNDDAETIYSFFCDGIPALLINIVQVAVLTLLLFLIQPLLAVLSLATIPIFLLALKQIFKKQKKLHAHRYSTSRRLNGFMADVFSGMRVVKAFSKGKEEEGKFNGRSERLAQAGCELSIYNNYSWPLFGLLLLLGTSVAWGVGGYMVMSGYGGMTYGTLLTFTAYMNMIYSPLVFFTDMFNRTADCSNAMQRLFEIMDAQPEIFEKDNALAPENIGSSVEFNHVSFSYIKGKRVINDVSFSVPEGGILGIVGHTGAGKSTLANLLLRLYDAEEGEIRIGGYPVKDLKLSSIYSQVAIVSQETYLFMGTILENIRYARPEATYDEVLAASRCAGAHDFIMKLPDAYHTRIGAGEKQLSGGERQRISIARAILKDPKILILDEATAAMDTRTERKIQEALEKLSDGKTTIMIAHRLSTLRSANHLIVMERGKMVEDGTHTELLQKENGVYRKLYTLQNDALRSAGVIDEEG